ncbi:major facilitator superfamily protein [Moniliophthora roreri]|uniref:Major facilitator superfamily (MFS) profile domain-containing protein n=1 Tax=Moniliophthora roreri TaxID=221103 RepID=A0A0W0F6C6_MONRR|nr:major facilitator superfamily protein [Moniliophthora roreri]
MSTETHSQTSASVEDVKLQIAENEIYGEAPESWFREEKKLVRKLDKRILPMACLLYLFAYLDRTNLGNARLQQLPEDVLGGDPTGALFNWVNSAFFFSYTLCLIPATIISKLCPPRIWLACAAFGWGLSSTSMAAGFNFGGLMTSRVFLGVFEAGFGPAVPLYFSLFYTKEEMGLRMAYWFGFAAVAGTFGGIVAFGIQHANVAISNWRLLFIVDGIPAIILGVLTLLLLPNRPESTSFLNERERKIALDRMNRATSGDVGQTVNKRHIGLAFCDWRIYTGGIIYFGLNASLASTSAFLPTIIKSFGYSSANSQLLTVPPYAVAAVVLMSLSAASDRLQSRGVFIIAATSLGGIGYLILLITTNTHVRYFATFCITSGTYTGIGIIIAWFAHNLGSETKKATGIPMFMGIGQCGSVLGSYLLPKTDGPRYIKGFAVCCILEFLASLCALVLTISYRTDNTRRNKQTGIPESNARVDVGEYADKAPNFRYVP